MNLLDIVLLAVSLGMDCFAVSMVGGIILQRWQGFVIWRTASLYGFFQALMPLAGWLAVHFFASRLETYGRWIAFVLLSLIGLRMIWQTIREKDSESPSFNPCKLSVQLLMAVATSIDALAVGISMAVTGYDTLGSIVIPLFIIGLMSLVMSLVGHWIGIRFGKVFISRLKPELLGGVILVALAVKVLVVS